MKKAGILTGMFFSRMSQKNESETFALKDGKSDVTVTVYDFMTSKTRIMHEYKIS